jgi:hypothetical protein
MESPQNINKVLLSSLAFGVVGFGIGMLKTPTALATGAIAATASFAGVLVTDRKKTKKEESLDNSSPNQIQELQIEESQLKQSIAEATIKIQEVETNINSLQGEQDQLLGVISDLNSQKQRLEAEYNNRHSQVETISQQQEQLNQALFSLETNKQELEININNQQKELEKILNQSLQTQIQELEQQSEQLNQITSSTADYGNELTTTEADLLVDPVTESSVLSDDRDRNTDSNDREEIEVVSTEEIESLDSETISSLADLESIPESLDTQFIINSCYQLETPEFAKQDTETIDSEETELAFVDELEYTNIEASDSSEEESFDFDAIATPDSTEEESFDFDAVESSDSSEEESFDFNAIATLDSIEEESFDFDGVESSDSTEEESLSFDAVESSDLIEEESFDFDAIATPDSIEEESFDFNAIATPDSIEEESFDFNAISHENEEEVTIAYSTLQSNFNQAEEEESILDELHLNSKESESLNHLIGSVSSQTMDWEIPQDSFEGMEELALEQEELFSFDAIAHEDEEEVTIAYATFESNSHEFEEASDISLDELTEEDISSHSDNQTNSTSEDYLKAQLELVDEKLNQLDSLVSPISEASFDDLNDLLSSPQDNKNLSISSED